MDIEKEAKSNHHTRTERLKKKIRSTYLIDMPLNQKKANSKYSLIFTMIN